MTEQRSYSEMIRYSEFYDRVRYLMLHGQVGSATFGFDRYLNQKFYASRQWKQARDYVIVRDNGCDLGCVGYEIHAAILVHHMNPIEAGHIIHGKDIILDPEFMVTTTLNTHNAIHFSDLNQLIPPFAERRPGDTKLW